MEKLLALWLLVAVLACHSFALLDFQEDELDMEELEVS